MLASQPGFVAQEYISELGKQSMECSASSATKRMVNAHIKTHTHAHRERKVIYYSIWFGKAIHFDPSPEVEHVGKSTSC